MKSLHGQHNTLADARRQLGILGDLSKEHPRLVPFGEKLKATGLFPLSPVQIDVFQVNIGKMCNQTCKHCHVDAGPDRKEVMTRDTMIQCLDVLQGCPQLTTVDITGGAPEMNPNFRWFVEEACRLKRHVIVRCNLTIILANRKYHDLPDFYRRQGVEVISSLPFYAKERTDRQRGEGVFSKSIEALRLLNEKGYGKEGSSLVLNLVYNPAGAFLPPAQVSLEHEYKKEMLEKFGVEFNRLFTITNLPINRFLDYLLQSGNYEAYMEKLINAYNPAAAAGVMCRNTVSVGWDGYLYDCDFNQMLDLKVVCQGDHVSEFNYERLLKRHIVVGQHCYGCTAGGGSSCGGSIV